MSLLPLTFNLTLLGILHPGGGSTQSFFQQQLIGCLTMIYLLSFFFTPPQISQAFPLPDLAWCRILALDPKSCITSILLLYSVLWHSWQAAW